jgi:integrase/recombinase XerD
MKKITFRCALAPEFDRFVDIMEGLGNYNNHFWLMRRLDSFLCSKHPKAKALTKDILAEWFSMFSHLSLATQRQYRSDIFLLCKFLRSRNGLSAVRAEFPILRPQAFKPYVFSQTDLSKLLAAARAMRKMPKDPLRPETFELVVSLLYACGLRISEVIARDVGDFDESEGVLKIRGAKFGKSRLVPVSKSMHKKIEDYLGRRRKLGIPTGPSDSLIWSPYRGRPSREFMKIALMRLMRKAGIKPAHGRCGPRVHDLRHTFAVYRLLAWYKEGADVQLLLPRLSTYLGHVNIQSTQHYLRYMPEVLAEASQRFEDAFAMGVEV